MTVHISFSDVVDVMKSPNDRISSTRRTAAMTLLNCALAAWNPVGDRSESGMHP